MSDLCPFVLLCRDCPVLSIKESGKARLITDGIFPLEVSIMPQVWWKFPGLGFEQSNVRLAGTNAFKTVIV